MTKLRPKSIKNRLIAIQIATALVAILVCTIFFLFNTVNAFKTSQEQNLSALAKVIGDNAESALSFGLNRDEVVDVLSDALKTQDNITHAVVLDNGRNIFASFDQKGAGTHEFSFPADSVINYAKDVNSYVHYYYTILNPSQTSILGYVGLRADSSRLNDVIYKNVITSLIAILIAVGITFLISLYLQKIISAPLLGLLDTVKEVSQTKDFSIQVDEEERVDEIGLLTSEFNQMLKEIRLRDKSLKEARDELEVRVQLRTRQLQETNDTLHQRTIELENINQELEQFAFIASHDLQEPLRSIGSFTQILFRKYKNQLGDEGDEFIHYIVDGVNRMQSLIQDLLIFASMGRDHQAFEITDCNKILQKTLLNLKYSIEENRATITFDQLPIIRANQVQIGHLMQNLISNAIKFKAKDDPRIHLSAEETSKHYIFSVEDNGIGIEKEFSDKVFKIFQRLHTKDKYPGTGVGLAICKKIVDLHKGEMWFDGNAQRGTTFYFTLRKDIITT